tara:strand:- start:485 stop:652 length:168 start_codon:yes stop_codon:yes gene_type:complete
VDQFLVLQLEVVGVQQNLQLQPVVVVLVAVVHMSFQPVHPNIGDLVMVMLEVILQ